MNSAIPPHHFLVSKFPAFLIILCGVLLCHAGAHAQTQLVLQDVTPRESGEALVNPGMGLYLPGTLQAGDMPAEAWFTKLVNIGYFRDDWSKLEPDGEGQYKFDEYFGPILDLWVKQWHKRVAFRFMAENMHSRQKYVTPRWVFDKGVPGVSHQGLYVPEQIDPVFWDEHYLVVQERFIADLGKYLDGRPGIEFMDIGAIGEWGEMHLQRWTPAQLEQTGYTTAKYIAAYRRIIDAFAHAFPHTRVFLNVGDYDTINDYAALRHLNFRQDGLNPAGPSANVGKRFYAPYARRGVVCNYELFAGYDEMKQRGWGVQATFNKGLEDPISYLHLNLMGYRELANAPPEVHTAIADAARRIGFRFTLSKVRCNATLRLSGEHPSRLWVESTWKNTGVAPCYASYALRWTVLDQHGTAVAEQLDYPQTPTTLWWPGAAITQSTIVPVPPGTVPGTCHLKVAMLDPGDPAVTIQLALDGRDAAGRYELATIPATSVLTASTTAYDQGFETPQHGWQAAPGIALATDADAHSGHGSLRVSGTQPGGAWNYAAAAVPRPVLPASRYRLSGWMKIDNISPGAPAPYLKIGLNDAQGKWITNCNTNSYDLSKLGTWQLLSGFAETPPDSAIGQLAVEKGTLEGQVTLSLRLDDVKLELIESP